jgi:NitT/TauT family transport system substrate-binding protein
MKNACFRRPILALPLLLLLTAASARAQEKKLEAAILAIPGPTLAFSLTYLAEDLDLWGKHGVKISTREIAGLGTINAVISGSVELGEPSGLSLTRAAARGQRLLAIAETVDHPVTMLVMRKEVAAAAGFDAKAPLAVRALVLKDRIIAPDSINSTNHAFIRLLARRGGFDPEAIRIAPTPPGTMLAAFDTKQIDGYAVSPPWPLKPVLDGTGVMIASGTDGDPAGFDPFAGTVIVARPETCEKRKALCVGVAHAVADAALFMLDRTAEATALLRKRFPTLDEKLLEASVAVMRKATPRAAMVSAAALENTDRFNIEAGLMRPDEKLRSYDGLFTDAYLR